MDNWFDRVREAVNALIPNQKSGSRSTMTTRRVKVLSWSLMLQLPICKQQTFDRGA